MLIVIIVDFTDYYSSVYLKIEIICMIRYVLPFELGGESFDAGGEGNDALI